jgi:hypothetical protein
MPIPSLARYLRVLALRVRTILFRDALDEDIRAEIIAGLKIGMTQGATGR